jgi:GntR family transcriptional regulator
MPRPSRSARSPSSPARKRRSGSRAAARLAAPAGTATRLDTGSPLPRWAQIAQILRQRIAEQGAGIKGLTDHALAREFGVSPVTVRQAVADLVQSGLVTRHRGKGTFVVAKPVQGSVDHLEASVNEWRVQGQDVRIEILERHRTAATIPTAAALEVRPGAIIAYLRRLRFADGHPVGIDYRYMLADLDERLDDADLAHETIWEVLERKLGLVDLQANTTIRAAAASDEEARLLLIAPRSPVLNRGFQLVTPAGQPILVGHSIYHPDRFIHATTVRGRRDQSPR